MKSRFAAADPAASKKYVKDILNLMKEKSSIQVEEIIKTIGKPGDIKFSKFINGLTGTPFRIDSLGTYLHKANSKAHEVSSGRVKKLLVSSKCSLPASHSEPEPVLADEQPKFVLISQHQQVLNCLDVLQDSTCKFVAMDMEFTRREEEDDVVVELLQIGYKTKSDSIISLIFDVAVLEKNQQPPTSTTSNSHPLQLLLSWLFENKTILIHDARMELTLLSKHFKMAWPSRFIDTQILYESQCLSTASLMTSTANDSDIFFPGLNKMIGMTGLVQPSKKSMHFYMNQQKLERDRAWKRPFQTFALEYAALDVILLLESFLVLLARVENDNMTAKRWQDMSASTLCILDDQSKRVGKRCNFSGPAKRMVSRGIFLDQKRGDLKKIDDDGGDIEEVRVCLEIKDLRRILPERVVTRLAEFDLTMARDLVMDVFKTPRLFMRDRTILSFATKDDDFLLTANELESLVSHLQIGPDNRAILEGSLHRLSCIRNLNKKVYGITIRLGRNIHGISATITDLLHSEASILLLGPPGSGKSAILRDCIRILSNLPQHVILVDTSNEIGGNGDKVHESLGYTRRMMVPSLADQERVMIEAVQNHTPDIIVVDEIGRAAEVKAASTIKLRGCRVIATAHGCDLSDLIKNPHLKGLVGGTEQVILGDSQAKRGKDGVLEKVVSKRAGQPVFDVIVQLEKNISNCLVVRIIHNVAEAVDRHLLGQGHHLQTRCLTRDGKLFVSL